MKQGLRIRFFEFEISSLCRSGSSKEKFMKISKAWVIFGGSAGDCKATRVGQLWISWLLKNDPRGIIRLHTVKLNQTYRTRY